MHCLLVHGVCTIPSPLQGLNMPAACCPAVEAGSHPPRKVHPAEKRGAGCRPFNGTLHQSGASASVCSSLLRRMVMTKGDEELTPLPNFVWISYFRNRCLSISSVPMVITVALRRTSSCPSHRLSLAARWHPEWCSLPGCRQSRNDGSAHKFFKVFRCVGQGLGRPMPCPGRQHCSRSVGS